MEIIINKNVFFILSYWKMIMAENKIKIKLFIAYYFKINK